MRGLENMKDLEDQLEDAYKQGYEDYQLGKIAEEREAKKKEPKTEQPKVEQPKADRGLATKAINIKGKLYVLVSDRIKFFNENYPNGGIETMILSNLSDDRVIVKALVTPNWETPSVRFTGHAQEIVGDGFINKTSALENAETSAVGRALAMMGIGVIDSIASVDEIAKSELMAKQLEELSGKVDYDSITNEKEKGEALAIKDAIEAVADVDQLKEVRKSIQAIGLSKETLTVIRAHYNQKMKQLRKV